MAAIKALGFVEVEETACVLPELRRAVWQMDISERPVISSSCPRVIELVHREYPGAARWLCDVPSPMVLHAGSLRQKWGLDTTVVFIGPCSAKREEAAQAATGPDLVLTFAELKEWLCRNGIEVSSLGEAAVSSEVPAWARLAVLVEGINGLDRCRAFIQRLLEGGGAGYYELLACEGGCLGGPGLGVGVPLRERRKSVLRFVEEDRK